MKNELFGTIQYEVWQKNFEKRRRTIYVVDHEFPYYTINLEEKDPHQILEKLFNRLMGSNKVTIPVEKAIVMMDDCLTDLKVKN